MGLEDPFSFRLSWLSEDSCQININSNVHTHTHTHKEPHGGTREEKHAFMRALVCAAVVQATSQAKEDLGIR